MCDDVRVAETCGWANGFEFSGTACRDGVRATSERKNRDYAGTAGKDSDRVRDEYPNPTATPAKPASKRRVYVKADGAGDNTKPAGRKACEKGEGKGENSRAVGAGYGVQYKSRRRSEKAGATKLSPNQLRKMRKCEMAFAKGLRRSATEAEKVFASFLKRTGIRYEFQKPVEIADRFYIVDFYLWEYATVVEIDGGYHDTETQKAKDEARTKDLSLKREYSRVLRISNEDVLAMSDSEKRDWIAKSIFPWFFKERS